MNVETLCLGALRTNCYLVTRPEGLLVIDPAEPARELLDAIGDRRVLMVLNTHGHFDHVGGNAMLAKRGAPIAIHPAEIPFLEHWFPEHPPIDRPLADGDVIAGLTARHLPGHSPGGMVFAGDGTLFCGDLLFAGSIGRTDLPGGSPAAMVASLRRLADYPEETMVYPGHGPPTTLAREWADNPFLKDREVRGG
jgi:glyoxylase-like metal-dependent hydrolase (beta-lactamase superfamily II)